ncbi:hypothetical protein D7241_06435 [Stutzerimonas sp. VN223-3]|uniref:hypothetical protein n=1 Tax=Stutzerimonas sp. VN223-3 TaxID=3384601 RepID=UPI0038B6A4B2
MIKLSPSQFATANSVLAALTRGRAFCFVSSQPGFGLTTCIENIKSRLSNPMFTIADHPELAGLDMFAQLYHHLNIDLEFQAKNKLPGFAAEIVSLREISTIFVDDIDMFLCGESAKRRTVQQLKCILTALPTVNIVISGRHEEAWEMFELFECSPHCVEAFSLDGFQDFNEYKVFFDSILAENSKTKLTDVSLKALYLDTKGNLGDTFLRLFHPAYLYKG